MKNLSSYKSFIILIVLIIYCFNPVFSKQINYPTINTLPDTTHKTKLQQGDDDPTPSLKSILKDEFKSYKEVTRVDTAFKLKDGQIMKVKLRHYCTYDGKISLPHKYLRMYHLSKFRTHNFITTLEVSINARQIFKGFIKKEDFIDSLDDELRKYAVLLSPNVEINGNELNIQYSISIPLSDVGKGFTIGIDKHGGKHIVND